MRTKIFSENGFSTLIFLSLLLMLSLLGINAIMTSTTEVDIAGYELNTTRALYSAEAGLEKAAAHLTEYYNMYGQPPPDMPTGTFNMGSQQVTYETIKRDSTFSKIMTTGAYKGLYALSDEYTITATATSPGVRAKTTLRMTVDANVVPIYQFAVFYEDDLEIAPGPDMTLGGRVHCNNDLYLQSSSSLKIDSYTTAAGNIFHGRHPLSGKSVSYGDVLIKDRDGNYADMENADGTWLDSTDPNWVAESIARWGGQVEDQEHGITQLKLPVVASGEPMDMIHRSDGGSNEDSYEQKAGLKIIDGQVYHKQADSTWLDVTADFTSSGILSQTTFYDEREGKTVVSSDLDISALNSSGYWPNSGIIYSANDAVNSSTQFAATRLVNATELRAPLTVTSDDPVYTLGDYNTVNKKSASIMTDALNILSNNWNDVNSWGGLGGRVASHTQVNAAYMTGNKPSGDGGGNSYSGGLENLPRFLENWNGVKFKWIGSAVDLWESEQATGYWGGSYYEPPTRDWIFDLAFLDPANLPPGTPLISVVMKTAWSESVAYDDATDMN